MAITVRFPNGQAITYNSAHWYQSFNDGSSQLRESKDGRWVATICAGSGAIVEAVSAYSVTNPIAGIDGDRAIDFLLKEIRNPRTYSFTHKVRALKMLLNSFNARTCCWKNS